MSASQRGVLPKDLEQARQRFRLWRQQRRTSRRIPMTLWRLAVRLAAHHGLSRTANALGLDYYRLKKQLDAAPAPPPTTTPAFVELAPPVGLGKQCLFETDNGAGVRQRLQLLGYDAAEVELLLRYFRNAD